MSLSNCSRRTSSLTNSPFSLSSEYCLIDNNNLVSLSVIGPIDGTLTPSISALYWMGECGDFGLVDFLAAVSCTDSDDFLYTNPTPSKSARTLLYSSRSSRGEVRGCTAGLADSISSGSVDTS